MQTGERIPKDSRLRRLIQTHSWGGNRRQMENPWRDNLRSTRGFCGRGGSEQQAVDKLEIGVRATVGEKSPYTQNAGNRRFECNRPGVDNDEAVKRTFAVAS